MRGMLRTAWGAALVATIVGPAIADDSPASTPYPSAQVPSDGASPQGGLPGSGGYGTPGMGSLPGPSSGPTNPDGSPIDGQGNPALSGADPTGAGAGGFAPGLGGSAGGSGAPPGIIGDFQPISRARVVTAAASRFRSCPRRSLPRSSVGATPGSSAPTARPRSSTS